MDPRAGGAGLADLCRTQGRQAWQRGPAAAGRLDRADDVARHFRRPGGPRKIRKPRPAARSIQHLSLCLLPDEAAKQPCAQSLGKAYLAVHTRMGYATKPGRYGTLL